MKKVFWILICMWFLEGVVVQAQEPDCSAVEQCAADKLISKMNFEDVEQAIQEILPNVTIDFKKLVRKIVDWNLQETKEEWFELLKKQCCIQFSTKKKEFMQLIAVAVMAASFLEFSDMLQTGQISSIGFYMFYMILMTMSLQSFQTLLNDVADTIHKLLVFMKALGPVYLIAVAITKGTTSSVGFYKLVLILIYAIELLIINFLLPLLHIYMVIHLLNYLKKEEYLSKLSELLEMLISWTTKTLLTMIVGLNLIQGLIAPAIDSLKRGTFLKGIHVIPIAGEVVDGAAEVILGTAVLIKNGIGIAGMLICFLICILPLLQVLEMTFIYKLAAALIQPITDKRIVGCISSVGDSCRILLKIVFLIAILFLLTIAIIAVTTT